MGRKKKSIRAGIGTLDPTNSPLAAAARSRPRAPALLLRLLPPSAAGFERKSAGWGGSTSRLTALSADRLGAGS